MPAMCENMNKPVEIAHLVELLIFNQRVAGSNPVLGLGHTACQNRREATGKKLNAQRLKLFSINLYTFMRSKLVQILDQRDTTVNRGGVPVRGAFTASRQLALEPLS